MCYMVVFEYLSNGGGLSVDRIVGDAGADLGDLRKFGEGKAFVAFVSVGDSFSSFSSLAISSLCERMNS